MKFETFVTTGYKYGLLNYPGKNLPSIRHAIEQCAGEDDNEQCIEPRKDMEIAETIIPKTVVPFEDVDGLTLEELTDYPSLLYRNRYLAFVMYDSIPVSERSESSSYRVEFEEPQEKGKSRYLYVIDTEKNKEATIDEVVEKQLIANMGSMNVQNRRRALGFLEKYVQSDRLETMQAIENYLRDIPNSSIRPYFSEYVKLPKRLIDQENK